jgi:hypothetical protein
MSIEIQSELANFFDFISRLLQAARNDLSPEEALDMWREENPNIEQQAEDREAIQEALDELAAGEQGLTIEEFDREFRRRNNLGPRK